MHDSGEPALARLMALPAFTTSGNVALKPGFERIRALLAGMGSPEQGREVVLIAGTNGKGSTASMLAALSTAAGVRTGLHTSPHLLHVGERMRVDGAAATSEWLGAQTERFSGLFDRVEPSFFEATLALSLLWFAEQDARRWVVEVGLGGRLDATNVLDPAVSVITSIGWDHVDLLGPTLADIAREKAGIARAGRPLLVGALPEEALAAVTTHAAAVGARLMGPAGPQQAPDGSWTLRTPVRQLTGVRVPLTGAHQGVNAQLALSTLDLLDGPKVPDNVVQHGFTHVSALSGLRARQEWVNPWCMVDVGHNPEAMAATIASFDAATAGDPVRPCFVLGFLKDKDVEAVGHLLSGRERDVVTVPTDGARGQGAADTAARLAAGGFQGAQAAESWPGILDRLARSGRRVLVAGSHHIAAEALEWASKRDRGFTQTSGPGLNPY